MLARKVWGRKEILKRDAFLEPLLPSSVREVVLKSQPGDVLKLKTSRGWHVLRVEDVMLDLRVQRRDQGEVLERGFQNKTYAVETMGCQMNQADSERMEGQLMAAGLRPAAAEEDPDVIVLNTCSIRDKAEKRVYARLDPHLQRKRRGEDVTIVVSGCVAQQEGEGLLSAVPEVDVVVGPQYANRLADVLSESLQGGQVCATADARIMEDVTMPNRQSSTSAWVNVIYGCNERCSYCVVPATRGSEQSRPMEAVKREVSQLTSEGYREVTLLGQNIDAWGRDLEPRRSFAELIRYVGGTKGLERLRFLTSHPRYISDELIHTVRAFQLPYWVMLTQFANNFTSRTTAAALGVTVLAQ
ncbi:miaB [Symbiodinium natans]|uniref:MiaB protein n=1 Tax=Symbiodinium natans TaxID=878477 RepID=A0A812JLQ1_9DINO|nr:miaB [Symbiodinium natans]